ncbi:MAG: hypothetical protein K1X64_08920 [Myxococcaceae bacterium]|nr:hypothetical protein [Myxococcaceae bacterium]
MATSSQRVPPKAPSRAKVGGKVFTSPQEQVRGLNKLLASVPAFRGLMNTIKKYQENQGNGSSFIDPERFANEVVLADKKLGPRLKQLGVTVGIQLVAFARDEMTGAPPKRWKHP